MNTRKMMASLTKDSMVYGVGTVVTQIVGLILTPFLTHMLATSEYAILALLQTSLNLIVGMLGLSLSSGFFYYYYEEKDDKLEQRKILTLSLVFAAVTGVFACANLWFFSSKINYFLNMTGEGMTSFDYVPYIKILAITAFFQIIFGQFRTILRAVRKTGRFVAFVSTQLVINLGFVGYFLLVSKAGVMGVLWGNLASLIVLTFIGLVLTQPYLANRASKKHWKNILAYSLPQSPGAMLDVVSRSSDNFFLNYFTTLTQVSYYAISGKVFGLFLMAFNAFKMAWAPLAFSIMKQENAKQIYAKIFRFIVPAMCAFGMVLSMFGKPILIVFTTEDYVPAYPLIAIFVIAGFFQVCGIIVSLGILLSKKNAYTSYSKIIAFIVNIGLNFILIPKYEAMGAVSALVVGYFVYSVLLFYFSRRLYNIPFEFWRMNALLFSVSAIMIIQSFLVRDLRLMPSIYYGCLGSLVGLGVIWVFGYSKDERQKFVGILKNMI